MVMRAPQVMIIVAACVLVADAKPGTSPPEPDPPASSGGSGGALGTQKSWPCSSCIITVPPSYDPSVPTPLVVSLHGDEGHPRDTHGIWKKAAQDNGYILFSPKCPRARGCTKGFSRGKWRHDGPTGSVAWINAQIDAVEAAYNIDRSRIYMVGGSRGAIFIGFYAELLAPRIAGAALYAGGAPSAANTCAACALPVYVLVGDKDFLLRDVEQARDWFLGCGSEVMFDKLPKVRHRDIGVALEKSKANTILEWFSARPNTCRVSSVK
jgi:poly(3-hydroxybutyrate) depolymerase